MALEVGRLVARIDIEGSFEAKIAAAKTAMEDAAKSAARFDDAMSKAGQSGAKVKVSDEPKRKIDDAAKSAQKLDDGLSKAAESGKRLDVSSSAESKIVKLNSTARDYGVSLKKAADEGRNLDVSDAAQGKIVRLQSSARDYGVSLKSASDEGRNLTVSDQPKQQLAETASVADQVNTKFAGLGVTMKQVVGVAGGAAGLGAVLTKGWDRITAIDTAQGKLRGLGHEAEGVSTIMSSALDSVTGTSYGLGDAATIAANAVAAGIQPGKDLTKYLTMTADASAIAGVSLGEMGRILNQVQTGQSAYAGDLSQLADRGIPIYQWLADEAGVAAEEIKGMASKGQISSQMLFSAIQNNIGGAAKELGGTLVGSLANVGAAFGRLGASAIDPFKDDIMAAAEGAQEFAGALAGVVGPAAGVAASALSGVAKVVGTIPTPILAATGALVALQKTGLGASMAGAVSTAMGSLRGVGETIALSGMYAKDGVKANGLFAASMDGIKGAAGGLRAGLGNVVNMLGGPLMIGLAGATVAVTDIIGSIQRASAAQGEISESAARAAGAHRDLALAIGEANGEMSDQAVAAAQSIVEESITSTSAAAEQASGIYAGLANWVDEVRIGYDGLKGSADGMSTSLDRSRLEGRVNEMQMEALKTAAGSLGIEMDEVSAIAQKGGPRWLELKAAMGAVGTEGYDMAVKIQAAADAANQTAEAARNAEPGSIALAEAFRVMADEASTAAEKAAALDAALVALAGPTYDADEAMANYWATAEKANDALAGLVDSEEGLAKVMGDGSLEFDLQTQSGRDLRDMFIDMRKATVDTVASGGDMAAVTEENARQMQALADKTPYTVEQLEKLAERAGFFKDPIELALDMVGGEEAAAEIMMVAHQLKGVEEGATINVGIISDEAVAGLEALGFKVNTLPNGSVEVVAQTEDARVGLQNVVAATNVVNNTDASVEIDTNAEWVTHALGITAATTEGLPDGHIEITDTTDANLARLANLDIEVKRDKHGRVLVNDADVDRARGRVNDLSSIVTTSQHRVNVSYSDPSFRGGGGSSEWADGGVRQGHVQKFADGGHRLGAVSGFLPQQAMLAAPHGPGGLVQWAEAETGGEAFIPLAPSKRKRSLDIWRETGRRLGVFANGGMLPAGDGTRGDMGGILAPMFGKFADGGITVSGLVNMAKGVEGAPYVWGGVNWGDCSGAVSALANYVSGRSPFGSRFATGNEGQALAERGFKPGRGKKGDLQIGWFNGGAYGGHTSATLPNGTNFEMGGGRGNGQYGGSAAGANSGQYTNHAHFPAENFADANTLGGAAVDNRTPRQKNIDAIVKEGQRRNLSDRDIQVALMTAEQESGTRVLANPADAASMGMANEGVGYDHDSTGIFQQRNNGAWGTLEDRMDPTKSSAMFYDELEKIDGRDSMALTQVAQKVQRSAYPDAYAKHEGKASEELAASKARLESLSKSGGGSGEGQKVFVTNWPSGGGSYSRSSASSDAIDEAKDAVDDAQKAAWVQDQSIAAMVANAAGRSDLIQVEAFANGGFHGVENHTAHIAPAGSYRLFGESETGGEAYIPLASHKRARSTQILAETARRMGYSLGAGVNLVGSVLTGNGLDTGWGGPSLDDIGIDTGGLRDALSPGVTAEAERAGQQIAAILQNLGATVDQQVEGTLSQVNDGKAQLRQQYSRAMI